MVSRDRSLIPETAQEETRKKDMATSLYLLLNYSLLESNLDTLGQKARMLLLAEAAGPYKCIKNQHFILQQCNLIELGTRRSFQYLRKEIIYWVHYMFSYRCQIAIKKLSLNVYSDFPNI